MPRGPESSTTESANGAAVGTAAGTAAGGAADAAAAIEAGGRAADSADTCGGGIVGAIGGAIGGSGAPGAAAAGDASECEPGAGGANVSRGCGATAGTENCGPGAPGANGGGAVWYDVGAATGPRGGNPSVDSLRTRERRGLASSEIGISCTCLFIRFPPRTLSYFARRLLARFLQQRSSPSGLSSNHPHAVGPSPANARYGLFRLRMRDPPPAVRSPR